MTDPKFSKIIQAMRRKKQQAGAEAAAEAEPEVLLEPCCGEKVHIAYRGVSDLHLYMSKDRDFNEIKFFRPHGLRVFCAVCRRRMV